MNQQMEQYANPSFFSQPYLQSAPSHAAHTPSQPPPQPPHFASGLPSHAQTPHQAQYNGPGSAFPLLQQSMQNGQAMMQPQTSLAMQQTPRAVAQSPYSSAPFSQPVTAPSVSSAAAQHFAAPSPASRHISPYATPQAQHTSQADQIRPMAAPVSAQPQQTPQSKSTPQPMGKPASPGSQNRERERVQLLLEINRELLQEIMRLQEQGKGGMVSQPAPGSDPNNPAEAKHASKEYIECMRRLQANLSWLATSAERTHKPNQVLPPGPAIMAAPQQPQVLADMYNKLQTMFPGWKGQVPKTGQSPGKQPGQPS